MATSKKPARKPAKAPRTPAKKSKSPSARKAAPARAAKTSSPAAKKPAPERATRSASAKSKPPTRPAATNGATAAKKSASDAASLVAQLAAPSSEVRRSAIEKLRALGAGARAAIDEAARTLADRPLGQRAPLAIGLAQLRTEYMPVALPVLAELIAVGAASERALIREVLALVPALGIHALPLLPALLLRLENAPREEGELLVQAVRGAGVLGAEAVFKAAQESSGAFGARLVALLDGYDRAEHIGWLGELSRHADAPVRRAAIEALGRRGGREVLPHLLRALNDSDAEVLAAARAGLRRVPGPLVGPVLAAYLLHLRQDPPEARNAAVVHASGLGVAGFEDIGPLLLDALGDRDAAVRTGAARGLEALAPSARAALPRLRAQRKDSSPDVRAAVESAIAAIEHSSKR